MKRSLSSFILLVLSISTVYAGGTGYILNGETIYLYKDGVKIESRKKNSSTSRSPASLATQPVLFFSEDELARCYFWSMKDSEKPKKNIYCIKKSELK